MATVAQIEANRRNAKRSTGPKTEAGKEKARMNALKHGRRAKVVLPVLPQEDPAELDARIRRWVEDMRPGDDTERELVVRAAKISFELDRLERCEIAQLAPRVRKAQAQVQVDDDTADQVGDLGRNLLYLASITTKSGTRFVSSSKPSCQDNPEAFLRGLEGSAEGCRWLRDRWAELGRLLRREGRWTLVDLYRSIRLQGKHPVHAIDNPDLNLQFLAWEVLEPTGATDSWKRCREMAPQHGNGLDGCREWREIADRPASREEALAVLNGVIDGRIARLEERIALYEEFDGEEATERADAASFDPSPEAEAVRRRRSTLTRELRQLIELVLKLQAPGRRRESSTTEDTEGEEQRDSHGANEADPEDRGADAPGVEGGAGSASDGTGQADGADERSHEAAAGCVCRPGAAGPRDRERGGRTAESRETLMKSGGEDDPRTAGGESDLTDEAKGETIKTLVRQRFIEMLGICPADDRSQSAGGCRSVGDTDREDAAGGPGPDAGTPAEPRGRASRRKC
jgi:hypothetical protein